MCRHKPPVGQRKKTISLREMVAPDIEQPHRVLCEADLIGKIMDLTEETIWPTL